MTAHPHTAAPHGGQASIAPSLTDARAVLADNREDRGMTDTTNIWIMHTKDGFYPIEPSEKCKPEDHGALNDHVLMISDIEGNILWKRARPS